MSSIAVIIFVVLLTVSSCSSKHYGGEYGPEGHGGYYREYSFKPKIESANERPLSQDYAITVKVPLPIVVPVLTSSSMSQGSEGIEVEHYAEHPEPLATSTSKPSTPQPFASYHDDVPIYRSTTYMQQASSSSKKQYKRKYPKKYRKPSKMKKKMRRDDQRVKSREQPSSAAHYDKWYGSSDRVSRKYRTGKNEKSKSLRTTKRPKAEMPTINNHVTSIQDILANAKHST
ncbi:hypothetical protein HDE_03116 [Halotydeus destructor]|nr:hypothetical protein HDE_03116 [Halotydeus destructor]